MSSEGQIFLSVVVLIVSLCRVIGCSIDQDKEEEEGDGVVSIGRTTCLCEQEEQVSQTNPPFFSPLCRDRSILRATAADMRMHIRSGGIVLPYQNIADTDGANTVQVRGWH